jgi:cytochrome c-type biogenesis protein CcmH
MFWIIAAAALFAAALVTFLPLLRGKSYWLPAALAMVLMLPAAGLWIYSEVGTPEAIDMPALPAGHAAAGAAADPMSTEEMDTMLAGLRARLTETPADLDGWVLLARTLKTMQRFPQAVEALEIAQRIAPDDPFVMVELAEARIFTSTDGRIGADSVAMLERAVEAEPSQQKGLWLLGVAAAQAGDDAFAISYWESLLGLLEAGSSVAQSVQAQINEARARLGMEVEMPVSLALPESHPEITPEPQTALPESESVPAMAAEQSAAPAATPPAVGDAVWQGTEVRISASEAAQAAIPPGAVMFVVIRAPGPAVGPPLGVRRLTGPAFPVELTITDGDSMLAERKISLESEVQLQARVSLSGSPGAKPGDWQSAPVTVPLGTSQNGAAAVELVLEQQVE